MPLFMKLLPLVFTLPLLGKPSHLISYKANHFSSCIARFFHFPAYNGSFYRFNFDLSASQNKKLWLGRRIKIYTAVKGLSEWDPTLVLKLISETGKEIWFEYYPLEVIQGTLVGLEKGPQSTTFYIETNKRVNIFTYSGKKPIMFFYTSNPIDPGLVDFYRF